MRLLLVADEAPLIEAVQLVADNHPDAVVRLGDLPSDWISQLRAIEVPRLGVHGNHDAECVLSDAGVCDLHMRRVELGDWSFAGFEGCVRYSDGPHQYTQAEAQRLVRRLPAADVLICHCPPAGVGDEPGDPAHAGFLALRDWVEHSSPRFLFHGHTTPEPRRRKTQLGRTVVTWVRGARTYVIER